MIEALPYTTRLRMQAGAGLPQAHGIERGGHCATVCAVLVEGLLAPIVSCCFPQASQLDSFSYEDGADRAARLQTRLRERAAAQEAAQRQCEARLLLLRKERRTSQAEERLKAWGTGFSSIKQVDNSWSRFGFVPKPSNAVGDAAGPSGAAAAGHDEVVEI